MFDYKQFEISRIGANNIKRDILPIIGSDGDFIEVKGKDAIIQAVRNLLMTPLGFYPFDPTYGSLLYKQLFEMNDEISENTIRYEVKDRIEDNIDEVRVTDVKISRKNKSVYVDIVLQIKNEKDKTPLSVIMKQMGDSILSDDETLTNSIWGVS